MDEFADGGVRDRMDLHEDKEKNLVTATFELPGLTKENVQLDVKDNVLTVAGESTLSTERDEKGYSLRERRFGQFSRSLPLPQGISVSSFILSLGATGVLTAIFTARGDQGDHGRRCPDGHLPAVDPGAGAEEDCDPVNDGCVARVRLGAGSGEGGAGAGREAGEIIRKYGRAVRG